MGDGLWIIYRRVCFILLCFAWMESFLSQMQKYSHSSKTVSVFQACEIMYHDQRKTRDYEVSRMVPMELICISGYSAALKIRHPKKLLASFRNVGHDILPLGWVLVELVIDTRHASPILFSCGGFAMVAFMWKSPCVSLLRNRKPMHALKAKSLGRKIFTSGFWL